MTPRKANSREAHKARGAFPPVVDPLQLAIGGAVLWAPGLALAWAFLPSLDWAKFVAASVVISLSVPTATMFMLNVFFGIPISPFNLIVLNLGWAAVGLAAGLGPRLERAWSP